MNSARLRRGYTLVEFLFILGVIGVGLLLSARTFATTARVYREIPAASNAMRSDAHWLRVFRDDAWAAQRIDAATNRVAFDTADWSFADGTISRTSAGVVTRWPTRSVSWQDDGIALTLRADRVEMRIATPSRARRPL